MREYLLAFALAAMPAVGNFAGGLVSERVLSSALHAAAGIVLAVVAVELLPESFIRPHYFPRCYDWQLDCEGCSGSGEVLPVSIYCRLVTVAVEEIVPQAHKAEETRWATACFIGGFALFALLSSYLGD